MKRNKELMIDDWERISLREKEEISAEIEQLMQEDWWKWCEEQKPQAKISINIREKSKKVNNKV